VGGTFGLTYRFRPDGLDPESSIYEVMLLDAVPNGKSMPPDSPLHMLKEGEKFAAPRLQACPPEDSTGDIIQKAANAITVKDYPRSSA
jgi:hypothetical protein